MDEHAFVDVWESCREVSPSHWRKRKPRLDSLKGRSKFHLPVLLLHQSCVAQCQERPCPMIFPTRGRDNMWVSSQLPQLCRTLPKRPTLSCSVQNSVLYRWGMRSGWENSEVLVGYQSHAGPTNCVLDLLRKPAYKLLGTPLLQMSELAHRQPNVACTSPTNPHHVAGSLCLPLRAVSASLGRCLWSTCR